MESGTSMAAPHVSAALALMKLHYGALSEAQMNSLIARTCTNLGSQYYYGKGIMNLRRLTANIERQQIKIPKTMYAYSGKRIAPKAQVTHNNQDLFNDKDYVVSYGANITVGRGSYTVKGIGSYSGQRTGYFNIVPKDTSVRRIKSGKRYMTVSWKRQMTQTSGYQLQYGRKKSMKKSKIFTVPHAKRTSKKIKNLKKNTRYYVRIRTYKNVGKKRYYSNWSSVKSRKIS